MTLYYSLVFALLVFEMIVFMTLIVPLPFKIKRGLFTFISENPLVAKLQYGLKITFIFILILFIDSVNRVYRVQVELAQAKYNQGAGGATVVAGSERMEVQARKFYSQRNMYLCGFTLFLSLILNRTYVMILDTLRLEEKVKSYEGGGSGKGSSGLGEAGNSGEIGRLKKELAKRDQDIETLKKQSQGLSDEYNRLGDQVSPQDSAPKKDR
ncbi:Putative B-cell receptor-associated protein 29/31 [Septoria linicola]|uniref:Endoplasmic reticulum transmembrane protein n=1 Tax=Septoria linicola TaxID=215465 RepID=A0A9Q9EGN2_9PEZI|nr:putative B-cell receptor-associated protein 29/31 [Septoria linicola]USW49094.1 Putative B-cell receptor-associated protein 29/31 [Septoria linicola]